MKMITRAIFFLIIYVIGTLANQFDFDQILNTLRGQVKEKYKIFSGRFPEYTIKGQWTFRDQPNWLSGFIGGELWLIYDMTGDEEMKKCALQHTNQLLKYSSIDYTHDMGFIFFPTCVESFRHTGEQKYRNAALQAADMLAKRFNRKGKFIRAWGSLNSDDRAGWMIIDTMMNLELLFWAALESGNWDFYDIAFQHALTTLDQSIRTDGSSYHVIEFDPLTGSVLKKTTHQGYSDESTWARGQAWGIYGFSKAFQYTKYLPFLQAAILMADYYCSHLPEDLVPVWDLTLSSDENPRDASAAPIAASGLFLLAELTDDPVLSGKYHDIANSMVRSLLEKYLFILSKREQEEGILLHTIYHMHKNWGIDESFPAGDYYIIEAFNRAWKNYQQDHMIQNVPYRMIYNMNKGWCYLEDNIVSVKDLNKSPIPWKKLDLPHTWNQWDAVDNLPGYRRDASWYEKKIYFPTLQHHQRLILYFEGANIRTDLYINDKFVGGHTGGYVGFEFDITPFITPDSMNTIRVRVDNSIDPQVIPSQKSDFFIYGGITRDVWLKIVPVLSIQQIQIVTSKVDSTHASTKVGIIIRNPENIRTSAEYNVRLYDRNGKCVAEKEINRTIEPGNPKIELKMPQIQAPELWSPEYPNLYIAEVILKTKDGLLDTIRNRYGYRWFEFKENGPFCLNGKRLLLRGTHRHEEHAGLGAAMSNDLHRRDIEMIKEMGANFVRLAHYPQDPEIYKACDELGLLVWDELPWCRGGVGDHDWKLNTTRLLDEQINQNINHPSIIIWSLGNEIYWLPDFPGGGSIDSLRSFLRSLNEKAHRLDPSRVTAVRKFYEGADIVDLFSPSIWAGWYSGVYNNYEKALEDSRKKYHRFFHAEYGGSSHVGRHVENPISGQGYISTDGWEEEVNQVQIKNIAQAGDWSENYIVDLFDWHLSISESTSWLPGNAQWAFKDFGTPLRPENPIPYLNQKGLTDRSGKPKDAYYVFKSYWSPSPKFCYIESHTWKERSGPMGLSREICVYSNTEAVQLILNGMSMGQKKRQYGKVPAHGLSWMAEFQEGDNFIQAIGYNNNKIVARDSIWLNYRYRKVGQPDHIRLDYQRLSNGNFLINAVVLDETGQRCIDYNERIYFSCDGRGKLLENFGTPTRSSVIEMANGYAAIEFKPVPGKKTVIEVRNQDFKGSYMILYGDDE